MEHILIKKQNVNREDVKMFLFSRWISVSYADTRDRKYGISVLNTENGNWYKDKLNYFNEKIYPEYVKNGTVDQTIEFLNL